MEDKKQPRGQRWNVESYEEFVNSLPKKTLGERVIHFIKRLRERRIEKLRKRYGGETYRSKSIYSGTIGSISSSKQEFKQSYKAEPQIRPLIEIEAEDAYYRSAGIKREERVLTEEQHKQRMKEEAYYGNLLNKDRDER